MDFAAKLNSPSVRDQLTAAMFLRAEGIKGLKYLPVLLQKCQAIETAKNLDRYEEGLLGFGAITMSGLIAELGFNCQDSNHDATMRWILELTTSPNINVAGHSVYALGTLGSQSSAARDRLCEIVISNPRTDEHEHVSLRAVALRLLRRIDPILASTFVNAPAFDEYAHAVEHWMSGNPSMHPDTQRELREEHEWLATTKQRRTTPR